MSEYIDNIPMPIKAALDRWAAKGHPTGHFVQAVLKNDLMEAVGRADDYSRKALREICMYVHNELPSGCHGSSEKVRAWAETMEKKRKAE